VDAWIGVIGAGVGALAALAGQWISSKTTERVAYRARQDQVLDDLSHKLAAVGQAGVGRDRKVDDLVEAFRALATVGPAIHDDVLRRRVFELTTTGWRIRDDPGAWRDIDDRYAAVMERLTEVYKKLG
jgi:hypothetical protein